MPSSHRSTHRVSASRFSEQETELLPVIEQGPREFEFFDDQPADEPAEQPWYAAREPRHHRDVTFRRSDPHALRSDGRRSRPRLQTMASLGVIAAVVVVAAVGWLLTVTEYVAFACP